MVVAQGGFFAPVGAACANSIVIESTVKTIDTFQWTFKVFGEFSSGTKGRAAVPGRNTEAESV
jgi:hypothetical protein